MEPLIIIPARGGSKGIPNKNIKLLNGKPLIKYAVDVARGVTSDSNIFVSTDSESIKSVVEKMNLYVPFLRPRELATDMASTESVLLHALSYFKSLGKIYTTIVLLQPTSPFRTSKHVLEAIMEYQKHSEIDMVASVKVTASNPYYVLFEEDDKGLLKKSKKGLFTKRQDCPTVYELNGAVYVINVQSIHSKGMLNFDQIKKYCMTAKESLDIDEPLDWDIAELLMKKSK